MAKLLRRMGTDAIKFQFGIVVNNLTMSIPVEGMTLCVRCVRGAKQTKSIDCDGKDGKFVWDQQQQRLHPMLMVNTLYRNKTGKMEYQKKTAQLVVKQKSGKDYKTTIGQVEINLADYLPFGDGKDRSTESTIPLSKCSDKRALLTFSVHVRLLHKAAAGDDTDDTVSRMEGMDSVGGGSHVDADADADLKEADEALQRKEQRGFGVAGNSRAGPIQSYTVEVDDDTDGRRRASTTGAPPPNAAAAAKRADGKQPEPAKTTPAPAPAGAPGKTQFSVPPVTEEDEDDEDSPTAGKTRVAPFPKSSSSNILPRPIFTSSTTTSTSAASSSPAPSPAPTTAAAASASKGVSFAATVNGGSGVPGGPNTLATASATPTPSPAPAKLPPPIRGGTASPLPVLPALTQSPAPPNAAILAERERELTEAREEMKKLQSRIKQIEEEQKKEREDFTSARNIAAEKLEQMESENRQFQSHIDRLLEENGLLRERNDTAALAINRLESDVKSAKRDLSLAHGELKTLQHENDKLRERQIRFDMLTAEDRAQKKWKAEAATKSLEKKVAYYEQQLKEADETLVSAKQALGTTSQVLMKEVAALETQLTQTKRLLEESLEGKSASAAGAAAMDKKLQRAIRDQMKLSEALNAFEVKLNQKSMELAASEEERHRLHDLLRSRGMLVPRAPNAPPPPVTASTSSLGRSSSPPHLFGTPPPQPTTAASIVGAFDPPAATNPSSPPGSTSPSPAPTPKAGTLSPTTAATTASKSQPSSAKNTASNVELMAALAAGAAGHALQPSPTSIPSPQPNNPAAVTPTTLTKPHVESVSHHDAGDHDDLA